MNKVALIGRLKATTMATTDIYFVQNQTKDDRSGYIAL